MKNWIDYSPNQVLHKFTPHGLEDLDKANLMNRIDSKFIIHISELNGVLDRLNNYYSVLEIDRQRLFNYDNIYFDTQNLDYYHLHHNGKLNRHKIRYRKYVDTNSAYLEVKFKNNKKRTKKSRIKVFCSPLEVIEKSSDFLTNSGICRPSQLQVAQKSGYKRIALANEAEAERLTIDMGLHFWDVNRDTKVKLDEYVIAELKQSKLNRDSPFYRLMRESNRRPSSFSKYCMGMYFTSQDTIKTNRFKSVARDMLRN